MDDTKTQCLLKLIIHLQGSRVGLTYEDIRDEFGADIRTVRRWVKELNTTFDEMEELEPHADGKKRWIFRPSAKSPLLSSLDEEDVSTLDTARKIFKQDGRVDLSRSIDHIRHLVNAQIKRSKQSRSFLENVDALVDAEGLVMHPGPRIQIDSKVMECLRYAILGDIHNPELLDETFDHREDFDLNKYAAQSFGVYQGDPANVTLRFSSAAAEEASRFLFHPTQKTELKSDGTLLVKFRASGQFEIACHLTSWEGHVEVVKPKELRELVVELGEKAVLANQ